MEQWSIGRASHSTVPNQIEESFTSNMMMEHYRFIRMVDADCHDVN